MHFESKYCRKTAREPIKSAVVSAEHIPTKMWCMWWTSVFCCITLSLLLKINERLHPVASSLQILSMFSTWPILQISRHSNKICKLPFQSKPNLAIYIASAAASIGRCPHSDIKLYTDAFISLVCSLTHLTVVSLVSCLGTLSTQQLVFLCSSHL